MFVILTVFSFLNLFYFRMLPFLVIFLCAFFIIIIIIIIV